MKLIHFQTIDSTCSYLDRNHKDLDDLTFVYAEYQEAGLGRNGRTWKAKSGNNLTFSFLLKNRPLEELFPYVCFLSAVSIAETLEGLGLEGVSIKWPNDVYVGGKKICGILLKGSLPEYLNVGIGLNVNQIDFDEEYRVEPTSLRKEVGEMFDLDLLAYDIREEIVNLLENLDKEEIVAYVREHNYLLDKEIHYKKDGITHQGRVVGISSSCALMVESEGKVEELISGEAELIH